MQKPIRLVHAGCVGRAHVRGAFKIHAVCRDVRCVRGWGCPLAAAGMLVACCSARVGVGVGVP